MKQNSNIFVLLGFLILVAVSGCSTNDDIVPEKPKEITLNGKKLTIKISEESFSAEQRTTRAADVIKTDTIDMGNGIIAERTILPDTTTAQESVATRAAMAEGHYTIFALDASGTRMPDELSGTVQAGQFVPDQNKSISLAPGTYTFVCFNDAVTDKGTGLAIEGEDCVNPMIGVTTKAVSGDLDEVSFQMIHYSARFRTEITSYTAYVDVDQTENDFYDDYAIVSVGNKWGIIDKHGNEVVPVKYDYVSSFDTYPEFAQVKLDEKYGFVNKNGEEVVKPKYEAAYAFSDGLAGVKLNGKWGFINTQGEEVIPFKYDYVGPFYDGAAEVELAGKVIKINKKGEVVK